jgi:hypothetical protein
VRDVVIENPVINSAFAEPRRHFRFDDDGITSEIAQERRPSACFIPVAVWRALDELANPRDARFSDTCLSDTCLSDTCFSDTCFGDTRFSDTCLSDSFLIVTPGICAHLADHHVGSP